jgi:hypothetical protein
MNNLSIKTVIAAIVAAVSISALASEDCTKEPKGKWLAEKDVKARFESQGYKVKHIKSEDSCYEVYAESKDGKKVELLVDPLSGNLTKEEGDS